MADDQRLQVQFSADIRDFEKAMAKLEGMTNSTLKAINRQARESSRAIDSVFKDLERKAATSLAAIGAAVGTKELIGLSDTWTTLKNKVAAVSQSTGMQARSMSDLVKGADDARSSIESYTDLYAKLMRSSSGIAKNEEEVARATNIVSKAFVAGGAAASEQAAGVLQLGQALGSGFLQGDELRSIRENAPLLAEAIAKEFNTTIGGLKDLGSEGKLTSDRVFKAILEAGASIEAQFNATNATMADGFTRIKNALTEYVGIGGQASGVSQSITQGLIMIADNFDKVADAGMVVVGVIAGQLVGRSLPALIKRLADAGAATKALFTTLNSATSLGGVLTAIGGAGPALGLAGAALGGATLYALNDYMQKTAEAAERSKTLHEEWEKMGLVAPGVASGVNDLSQSLDKLGTGGTVERLKSIRTELDSLLRTNKGDFIAHLPIIGTSENEDGVLGVLGEAYQAKKKSGTTVDAKAYSELQKLFELWQKFPTEAARSKEAILEISKMEGLSRPFKDALVDAENLRQFIVAGLTDALKNGADIGAEAARQQIADMRDEIARTSYLNEDQRKQLSDLLNQFQDGQKSADEFVDSIKKIDGSGNFTALIGRLTELASHVEFVGEAAANSQQQIQKLSDVQLANLVATSPSGAYFDQYDNDQKARADYDKEVKEYAKKTKKQIDLEKELDNQRTKYEKKNGPGSWDRVPYSQQVEWAKTEISGNEGRKESTKKPKAVKENDYERLTKSLNERVATIKSETEAQAQLNPFINDYGFSLEKAKTQQELLNAAAKAKIPLDKDTIQAIDELSTKLATASSEQAKLVAKQEEMRQKLEAVKDVSRDVSRTFIDSMIQGKKATEALGDACMRLGQRLLDAGLDAVFDKVFTVSNNNAKSSGGFLGGIGKIFGFATGGYTGDGGTHEPAGIVHGGEYVFSRKAVQNAGVANLEAMHNRLKGYANGGFVGGVMPQMPRIPSMNDFRMLKSAKQQNMGVDITVGVSADNNGNLMPFVESVSQRVTSKGIQQYDHVLDQTAALKVQNSRAMGRSY